IKKATTFPPFPLLKSFQICLTGDTMKLGERSSVKGLSPLKLEPDFFNCTKSPITSSRRAVSYTLSMVVFAIKVQGISAGPKVNKNKILGNVHGTSPIGFTILEAKLVQSPNCRMPMGNGDP